MRRREACGLLFTLLLASLFLLTSETGVAGTEARTIIVPDDYEKIQWALNNASDGDTIYVRAGIYYENLVVSRAVSLSGENETFTIIDGNGTGTVVSVRADNVTIMHLTVQSSGSNSQDYGIYFLESDFATVSQNVICNNSNGIRVYYANNATVVENTVKNNGVAAFSVHKVMSSNISSNILQDNEMGMGLVEVGLSCIVRNNITRTKDRAFMLVGSYFNNISENVVTDSAGLGFYISSCGFNTLRDNSMSDNHYNFGVVCGETEDLAYLINDVDASNKVDGKPIYYWVNQHNRIVSTDAGYVGLVNSTGITIENLTLTNNFYGIILEHTANCTMKNLEVSDSFWGMYATESPCCSITNNRVTRSQFGIELKKSSGSFLGRNRIEKSETAISIYDSGGTTITENNLTDNYYSGAKVDRSPYCTLSRNRVENTSNGYAISVYTGNSIIDENHITKSYYGIYLSGAQNNLVNENHISNCSEGIVVWHSSFGNNISRNTIINSSGTGVSIQHSSGLLVGNKIANNNYGVFLWQCSNNTVARNDIVYNKKYGLSVWSSSNNSIHHNNFANNTGQVYDESWDNPQASPSINTWDEGYPYGGVYWSDYTGTDLYCGLHQNETGSDGIGDTPYLIDENNEDAYPLKGPYGSLTIKGQNSTVFPKDYVNLIFENVAIEGSTTVKEAEAELEPPPGFQLVGKYYNITTTASHSGKITTRIIYDDSYMTSIEEEGLQLVQWNDVKQKWQTITTRIDPRSNVIYGETRHLSIFGVTRRATLWTTANISFYPEALNLESQGQWFNALIELPESYSVYDIDISSLTLNQTIPADLKAPPIFGDFDNDNIPDVIIRFSRTLVIECVLAGEVTDGSIALLITGVLPSVAAFEGISTIMVSGLPGDVNGDGAVTLSDVISASASYGSREGKPRWNPNANFAPSWDIIDIYDIVTITYHYGESSRP